MWGILTQEEENWSTISVKSYTIFQELEKGVVYYVFIQANEWNLSLNFAFISGKK